jgi:sulfur-oxidizing protein SoxB
MNRREFLQLLALASASGMALDAPRALAEADGDALYQMPPFGNVHLLHFTDCHAQLMPLWYREPDTNLGVGAAAGKPPHLVGDALLNYYRLKPATPEAYALTSLDFAAAASTYGKTGGFAHLATLIKRMRMGRSDALLLDGGDTWQGSATALWTRGQDMVNACKLLNVDIMTGHWEFTLGSARVQEILSNDLDGLTEFLAQNVKTDDFEEPVFASTSFREMNDVKVAVIGQAFPYTPIAHPRQFTPNWRFGLDEDNLQKTVTHARLQGADLVVLLSHNGMDVDLKMASRISGIDVILGGHTHDAVPAPVIVGNRAGNTLVVNSGSHGKFLSVLDLSVSRGRVRDYRYRLMPVFSNLLPEDAEMAELIEQVRQPFMAKLSQPLAVTNGLLYRRGNFNGTWDQLIVDALREVKGAEIAFSPGFRWGGALLPGDTITLEDLMNQTAITYPGTTVTEMKGSAIKAFMEDVCDNLFNPDPYLQQGGDMVRAGGLTYTCAPSAEMGDRIRDLRVGDKPLDADRTYKVAGWAPLGDKPGEAPIWEVVTEWLKNHPKLDPITPQTPELASLKP